MGVVPEEAINQFEALMKEGLHLFLILPKKKYLFLISLALCLWPFLFGIFMQLKSHSRELSRFTLLSFLFNYLFIDFNHFLCLIFSLTVIRIFKNYFYFIFVTSVICKHVMYCIFMLSFFKLVMVMLPIDFLFIRYLSCCLGNFS